MGHIDIQESACDCLQEIVNKGRYLSYKLMKIIVIQQGINTYQSILDDYNPNSPCLINFKGMDSAGKTRLVESLSDVLVKLGVMDVSAQEMDVEFLVKLSTLLNRMGVQLIVSFNK